MYSKFRKIFTMKFNIYNIKRALRNLHQRNKQFYRKMGGQRVWTPQRVWTQQRVNPDRKRCSKSEETGKIQIKIMRCQLGLPNTDWQTTFIIIIIQLTLSACCVTGTGLGTLLIWCLPKHWEADLIPII